MAAPPSKTLKDLNGQWVMNKPLSDDFDSILALQSVSWLIRTALTYATVTLTIKQYTQESTTHIDISQTVSGGIQGTTELRTLDNSTRPHKDGIFGEVRGKSRWVRLGDLAKEKGYEGEDGDFLKKGWMDTEGEAVHSWVESVDWGWTADQVWGFEVVEGKRYYVRHVVVRKGKEVRRARLVYDYVG